MAHCLDYDDVVYESIFHPSGAVVAAGLAIAERNRPIGGKDFITAVALGQDLVVRLALAIPAQRKPPWHRKAVLGAFSGAATAAKLLKLDEERIVDSLGIALCQAAGPMEMRWGVGTDLGILEIETKQSGTFRGEVKRPYGHPDNPISWEAAKEKFRDCFQHAFKPLPGQNATKVIDLIERLEQVADVAEVTSLLS